MEEKKENFWKAVDLSLVALVVVGVVLGFSLKKALKPKITSSPEDRKIVAVKQEFDFNEIQKKLDEEMEKAQAEQAPTEGQPIEAMPAPTEAPQAE